jgi:hypothetical protein
MKPRHFGASSSRNVALSCLPSDEVVLAVHRGLTVSSAMSTAAHWSWIRPDSDRFRIEILEVNHEQQRTFCK